MKRKPRIRIASRVFEQCEPRLMLTNSWGLDAIDAPEVWGQGYRGKGVVVAVIDSGIDVHADLIPNIWVNREEAANRRDDDKNGFVDDMNGWNFVEDDNVPLGANDHGSHMAGTIAADRNSFGTTGVAYEAKIMPLRVFQDDGVGSTNDVANAIRYAVSNGADVINLSIGGTATTSVTRALEYAAQQEVLVVAAAGNEHASQPVFPAIHSAELDNVISVGAHDKRFQATATSNRVGRSGAVQVDAPGFNIESTVSGNSYASSSGTSTAAAHVAGVAALALSANPKLSAVELRNAIVDGVSRRTIGSDSVGAVNAKNTVAIVTGGVGGHADFDNDGYVDFHDFLAIAKNFGKQNVTHQSGDANGDGRVSFADFIWLAQTFGQSQAASARRAHFDSAHKLSAVPPQANSQPTATAVDSVFEQSDQAGDEWSTDRILASVFA